MKNTYETLAIDGVCFCCKGSGMKVLHNQGDPVEGVEQTLYSRTIYVATTYVPCECRIVRSTELICPKIH